MPGRAYDTLFAAAVEQYGFITQEQARERGVSKFTLVKMAERGQVERVAHGLYRFTALPAGALDTYMQAALWPRGAAGVLSHETVLDLYELSDVNPVKIHLTVPASYRTRRAVPAVYAIHRADLEAEEITWHEGLPLTTLERAILDCHQAHVRRGLLEQALEQARARGLLTAAQEGRLRKEIASIASIASSAPTSAS